MIGNHTIHLGGRICLIYIYILKNSYGFITFLLSTSMYKYKCVIKISLENGTTTLSKTSC